MTSQTVEVSTERLRNRSDLSRSDTDFDDLCSTLDVIFVENF